MQTVNKFSPLYMNATFRDELGNLAAPTTIEWRVYDPENEEPVNDWQLVEPPLSSVDFVVPGSLHTIVDAAKVREVRTLQVRIDVGLPTEAYESFAYYVLNRPGGT